MGKFASLIDVAGKHAAMETLVTACGNLVIAAVVQNVGIPCKCGKTGRHTAVVIALIFSIHFNDAFAVYINVVRGKSFAIGNWCDRQNPLFCGFKGDLCSGIRIVITRLSVCVGRRLCVRVRTRVGCAVITAATATSSQQKGE